MKDLNNPLKYCFTRMLIMKQLENYTDKADNRQNQRHCSNSHKDTGKFVLSKRVYKKLKYKSCKNEIQSRIINQNMNAFFDEKVNSFVCTG